MEDAVTCALLNSSLNGLLRRNSYVHKGLLEGFYRHNEVYSLSTLEVPLYPYE